MSGAVALATNTREKAFRQGVAVTGSLDRGDKKSFPILHFYHIQWPIMWAQRATSCAAGEDSECRVANGCGLNMCKFTTNINLLA